MKGVKAMETRKEAGFGSAAPPIDLTTDGGEHHSLASLKGSPVLISFLSHAA